MTFYRIFAYSSPSMRRRNALLPHQALCCLLGILCALSNSAAQSNELLAAATPATETFDEKKEVPAGDEDAILKLAPESIEDLIAVQKRVSDLLEKSMAATVGILTQGSGSGVIISKDGYVLTAGHVSMKPGSSCVVVMADGEHLKAKSLGKTYMDAGLVKIDGDGPFPFVEMGTPGLSKPGDWCYVVAHPGGVDEERGLVVRIGRVIRRQSTTIQTDCRLIGGDSGGPLFNMDGEVIGINSRIKAELEGNYHVAIRLFKRHWEDMQAGKVKSTAYTYIEKKGGYLGVQTAAHARGVMVTRVFKGSPAQKRRVRPGDVIFKVNGKKVVTTPDFSRAIGALEAGETATLTFFRRNMETELKIELDEFPKK